MQTSPACLACLNKQARYTLGLIAPEPDRRDVIMAAVERYLTGLDPSLSPPENATGMYRLIASETGCPDPYLALKQESTALALALRGPIREKIAASAEPLLAACKFAAAGNIIDYGAHHDFAVEATLERCLHRDFAINDFTRLRADLARAKKVLLLADNCGEVVLDGLLIDQLGREVVVAVKQEPVINDVTLADLPPGFGRQYRVISNGTACPGTPLRRCSEEFLRHFQDADLIISKGQGNFETLSTVSAPLYFLLTVKCAVVADHLRELRATEVGLGEMILCKQKSGGR